MLDINITVSVLYILVVGLIVTFGIILNKLDKTEQMLKDLNLEVQLYDEFKHYKSNKGVPVKKKINKVGTWTK